MAPEVTRARVLAVTGGIASGKSEVTRRFEARGVPVLDADVIARALVEPGQPALDEIAEHFGPSVLDANGRLDRRRLRERVFDSASARRELEAILHPRIHAALREGARRERVPWIVLAIPLLAESNRYDWVDRVLVVDVPRQRQLERVMRRDGVDGASAEATLAAQASREARLGIATDVIVNDGSLADLDAAVERLYGRLTRADSPAARLPVGTG